MKTLLLTFILILPIAQIDLAGNSFKEQTYLISVKIEIDQNKIFYKGIPAYVPFTLTNTQEESYKIPEWSIIDIHTPIGIELTDPNGQKYTSSVDRYGFILGEGETNRGPIAILKKKWMIEPNKNVRCLVNIGYAIERIKVFTGKYQMKIFLWENYSKKAGWSDTKTIYIEEIPAEDRQWLSEHLDVSSWGIEKITRLISPSVIKTIPNTEFREQLAFNIILNILASQKNLAETKINGYENLVAPYLLPEIELFKYEILLAKQEKDKAEKVKKELNKNWPSMDYWLKQADDGKGYIKSLKSMRIESIEKYAGLIDSNTPG
jgi:hypothetical protein